MSRFFGLLWFFSGSLDFFKFRLIFDSFLSRFESKVTRTRDSELFFERLETRDSTREGSRVTYFIGCCTRVNPAFVGTVKPGFTRNATTTTCAKDTEVKSNTNLTKNAITCGVETHSEIPENIILASFDKQNIFAAMIQLSFYKHLPLRLTPESVWLTISQGFSRHVRYNRDKLVKARLIVSNDNNHEVVIKKPMFVKGVQHSSILGSGVHGPSHTTLSYK